MMPVQGTTDQGLPAVVRTPQIFDLLAIGHRVDPGIPLVIHGEPGTGKDTLARLIHAASESWSYPFVKVNCAGRAADHQEADLFGEEKGASPLANRRRLGSFEFANHGTLYLDEIRSVSHALIPKLRHVLRTREVSRVGGREIIHVDVRLIASTVHNSATQNDNDLWRELRRLNAVEIYVPPLRQRCEEIPVFASFFLDQFNRRYRRDTQLCPDMIAAFLAHSWPGNIRELETAVHQAVVGAADARSSGGRLISGLLQRT